MTVCIGRNDMTLSGFLGSDPEPLVNSEGEVFAYQVDIADSSRSRFDEDGKFIDKTQWETVKYYRGKKQSMEKFQKFGLGKKGDLLYIPSCQYITDSYTDPETGNPRRFSYFRIKTYLPFIPKSIYELYWDREGKSEEQKLSAAEKDAIREADSQSSTNNPARSNPPSTSTTHSMPKPPVLTGTEANYDENDPFTSTKSNQTTQTSDSLEDSAMKIFSQWLDENLNYLNSLKLSDQFKQKKEAKDKAFEIARERMTVKTQQSNVGTVNDDFNKMIQETAEEQYLLQLEGNKEFLSGLNSTEAEDYKVALWEDALEAAKKEFSSSGYTQAPVDDSDLRKIQELAKK